MQYEFEAEGKSQVLLDYKEARAAMGAMIDKYKNAIKPHYEEKNGSEVWITDEDVQGDFDVEEE